MGNSTINIFEHVKTFVLREWLLTLKIVKSHRREDNIFLVRYTVLFSAGDSRVYSKLLIFSCWGRNVGFTCNSST